MVQENSSAGKIKLFCLAYAGGSALTYNKINQYLDNNIELIPIEYDGRGKIINEEFYPDMASAVDDVYKEVSKHLDSGEFAVYGHSLGGVVTYELCKKLKKESGREPGCIFISGRYPPHIIKEASMLYKLPDEEFKEEILRIGGTPKEVFENKELAKLFVPILRADYKIIEQYRYVEENVKFKSKIIVLGGKEDKTADRSDLYEWQKYSEKPINVFEFDGGHFFINEYTREVTEVINETLIGTPVV
ncbi:MAG TPA: thioesterase domain-containing protein [Ruminiclostridium sp.]|nr:thioesterase domain-containing protein [Ruminiclostridium sp.]